MATLYVKDVPDDLYAALQARARKAGRSLSAEIRKLLDESIGSEQAKEAAIETIHRMRERFAREGRSSFDVTQSIRDDRDR